MASLPPNADRLTVEPMDGDDDRALSILARRAAGEAMATFGLLLFLTVALGAFIVLGDAPGIATALEAHR